MANIQGVAGGREALVPFKQQAVRQQAEHQGEVRQQRQGIAEGTAKNISVVKNRDVPNINRSVEQQIARAQNRNETVIEQRIQQGATPREQGGVPQNKQQGNIDLFA